MPKPQKPINADMEAVRQHPDAELRAAYDAGNLAGLVDALAEHDDSMRVDDPQPTDLLPVPRWALLAASQVLLAFLNGKKPGHGTGRHANFHERYVQDQIDLARYNAVRTWRRLGLSKEEACCYASQHLSESVLGGSEATMRNSHDRVAKRLKTSPGRYYTSRHLEATTLIDRSPNQMQAYRRLKKAGPGPFTANQLLSILTGK